MALSDASKLNLAFKKLQGKAQTDNTKEVYNEASFSSPSVIAASIPALEIPSVPSASALYDVTRAESNPILEYLRLPLELDPASNGHGFFAKLPSAYETLSLNAKEGTGFWLNSQKLCLTQGQIQIIPPLYGNTYEARLWTGGSEGGLHSGTLIPPLDARDWVLDYFNGILYQQTANASPVPSFLECLVYIGPMLSDPEVQGGATTITKINDGAYTMTFGQVVYLKPNDRMDLADALLSNLNYYDLGMVASTTPIPPGEEGAVFVKAGTIIGGFTGLTPGEFCYVSNATPGAIIQVPTGFSTGTFLYQVGSALNATQIRFNPEFILEL